MQRAVHPDSLQGAHKKTRKKHGWRKIQPAQSGLKASVWINFGIYKVDSESELEKSRSIC